MRTAFAAASTVQPAATSSANFSRKKNVSFGLPVFMCPLLEVESRITKYSENWQCRKSSLPNPLYRGRNRLTSNKEVGSNGRQLDREVAGEDGTAGVGRAHLPGN